MADARVEAGHHQGVDTGIRRDNDRRDFVRGLEQLARLERQGSEPRSQVIIDSGANRGRQPVDLPRSREVAYPVATHEPEIGSTFYTESVHSMRNTAKFVWNVAGPVLVMGIAFGLLLVQVALALGR